MAKNITWLHLSDLHVCNPKSSWDYHVVLDSLLNDLENMEKKHDLHPDIMFFTGDIAYGQIGPNKGENISEQFALAQTIFDKIRKIFSREIPLENIFIIPGNHDVNRTEVTIDQIEWLDKQQDAEAVLRLIQNADKQWQRYMERLTDYHKFLELNGYKHLLDDPQRLIYSAIRQINDVQVGISGLNSAWSCGRDNEKGKIWFGGLFQLNSLKKNLKNANFCICLSHYPMSWLVSSEDPQMTIKIELDYRFFLHGHEHKGWVYEGKNHIKIASAACYERSDKDNGYNFVKLDLDRGIGEIWLRKYDSSGGGWIPRVIAGGKTDNDGKWTLNNLDWLFSGKYSHKEYPVSTEQKSVKETIRDLWSFGEDNPTLINIVAPDTRRREGLPDKNYPDYSFMEFLGDKDTVVEVSMQLARLYPQTNIIRYPCCDFPSQSRTTPIVVIGGPHGEGGIGGNTLTMELMEYWKLPIQYTDDLEGLIINGQIYRAEYDKQDNLSVDYGVVARLPNPWDPKKRILMIQGIHTFGVLGITLAITNSIEGKANSGLIVNNCGIDPIFFCCCKVPVISGLALVPKFDPKNIMPLKL